MPEKLEPEFTGNVVDYHIDADEKEDILSLPNGQIIFNILKKLIGRYRDERKGRETQANRSSTIFHLDTTLKQIQNLNESLELIPQNALAELDNLSYQRNNLSFFVRCKAIQEELMQFSFLLNNIAGMFERQTDKKGEKPKTIEKKLLANTALLFEEYAGFKKIQAANWASSVLNNITTPINYKKSNFPTDASDARRIVKATIEKYGLDCPKLE